LSFCFRIVELYFETYAGTNIRRRQLHLWCVWSLLHCALELFHLLAFIVLASVAWSCSSSYVNIFSLLCVDMMYFVIILWCLVSLSLCNHWCCCRSRRHCLLLVLDGIAVVVVVVFREFDCALTCFHFRNSWFVQ
jgi:hypothetical protein